MKIYLHIGTEKTGTTSIQAFLAEQRESLLEKKVLYANALGMPNNINLVIAFQDHAKIDDHRVRAQVLTEEAIKDYSKKLYEDLHEEIKNTGAETLVISNEHLSSRFTTIDEMQRLYQFLSTFADDIEVVIYLRSQDSFFESLYSTGIKSGNTFDFDIKEKGKERHDFNYENMLNKWSTVFGKERMRVRLFDKKTLFNGDVVEDFIHLTQLPVEYSKENKKNENLSLGRKKIAFLKVFNQFVPDIIENQVNHLRADIVKVLEKMDIEDSSLKLTDADRNTFLSRFKEANRRVSRAYFSKDADLFESKESKQSKQFDKPLHINMQTSIMIAANLWIEKQKKQLELMNENLFLKCELALERHELHEAEELINRFDQLYPKNPKKHYLRSRLFHKMNKIDMAISEIKQVLDKNNNNTTFKEFYTFLQTLN